MTATSKPESATGSLATAGRLAAGPSTPADLPEFNPTAAETYARLYHNELSQRDQWMPVHPNFCVIPLSAGEWPGLRRRDVKLARRKISKPGGHPNATCQPKAPNVGA